MSPPPCAQLVFLLFLSTLAIAIAISQDTVNPFTWLDCPSASPAPSPSPSNFTKSTFQVNIGVLLDALPSAAVPTGFAALSHGEGHDRAFVRGLCRGDSAPEDCRRYLTSAVQYINGNCSSNRRAAIWYDKCFLSYADTNTSTAYEDSFHQELYNIRNVSDPESFEQTYYALMGGLVARAANDSARMFATGETKYTLDGAMYGLVQCMRDRTAADCFRCLQDSVQQLPSCCWGHQGGVVLGYNCYVRFEIYPYYDVVLDAPPPAVPGQAGSAAQPSTGERSSDAGKKRTNTILAVALPLGIGLLLVFMFGVFVQRRRIMGKRSLPHDTNKEITYVEPEQLNLPVLRAATANFSEENKLGEGGFGEVFKGVLQDGQEIAVKRLSKHSAQGFHELKNELVLAAKLKHRNLVQLLGVCLQEEKLVVYEFMPNRSLDTILFDSEKRRLLDWRKRYMIIHGIVRGLLYLHEESHLKVVHRDLKPSNVLLDSDMNPKISDFGLARAFGGDQSRDITRRPVGTLGYMSPEYAYCGHVSTKSDMFSFGVIVLEIVTGRRNTCSSESAISEPLLNYVWKNWSTGSIAETVDPSLDNKWPDEVFRCIHIGLLCVQKNPMDRPDMSAVVLMLNGHSSSLQAPSRPAYFFGSRGIGSGANATALFNAPNISHDAVLNQLSTPMSKNEVSISELEPR